LEKQAIITIDGPAGAGKSTVSKLLAARLSFVCLDTGALYRAAAYLLKGAGWNGEIDLLADSALPLKKISLRREEDRFRVIVDGEDVSDKIRTEEIGLLASRISAIPWVRRSLLPLQREMAIDGGIVAEGRDMGSVVFPDADVKFFLDALASERTKRRYLEMTGKGEPVNIADVGNDLLLRDRQDRERNVAPLIVPEGAVVVDSSDLTISQVVDYMMSVVERVCPRRE
jgi:cytidylate kinase